MRKYKVMCYEKDNTPGFRDSHTFEIESFASLEEATIRLKGLQNPIRSNKPKHIYTEMESNSNIERDYWIDEVEE